MEQRVGTGESSDRTRGSCSARLKGHPAGLGCRSTIPNRASARRSGDLSTVPQPPAGLCCHGTVADFLSELSQEVTSLPFCFFINVSAANEVGSLFSSFVKLYAPKVQHPCAFLRAHMLHLYYRGRGARRVGEGELSFTFMLSDQRSLIKLIR